MLLLRGGVISRHSGQEGATLGSGDSQSPRTMLIPTEGFLKDSQEQGKMRAAQYTRLPWFSTAPLAMTENEAGTILQQ